MTNKAEQVYAIARAWKEYDVIYKGKSAVTRYLKTRVNRGDISGTIIYVGEMGKKPVGFINAIDWLANERIPKPTQLDALLKIVPIVSESVMSTRRHYAHLSNVL